MSLTVTIYLNYQNYIENISLNLKSNRILKKSFFYFMIYFYIVLLKLYVNGKDNGNNYPIIDIFLFLIQSAEGTVENLLVR